MPSSPNRRPAQPGATRRGHYRSVSGVPVDAITASGAGGGGGTDHGITELTGDVTAGPGDGSQAATIGANKVTTAKILDANVTSAKLRDSAALSVIGRSANSSGVPADIAAATNGHVLQRLANVLGFSALDISAVADGTITLAKLADLAALSVLGRAGNTSGVMAAITAGSDGDVLRRSGTAVGFGAIAAAGITDGVVTRAKLADAAALSVIGRSANSSGVPADIAAAAASAAVLRESGSVLGFGTVATAGIADAAITLAKQANLATQTLIGRNTGSTGVPEAVTLTQLLDWIGSATQGDVLVRGAASWQRLAAGALGTFIGGNGAGATPSYQTPTGVSSISDFITRNYIFASGRTTANPITWGHLSPAAIVTPTVEDESDNIWQKYTQSGTSVNLRAGFDSNQRTLFRADNDPILEFVIKTSTPITQIRIWILMSDTATSGSADDLGGTSKYMGFRFSTVAGDGGWVGVCRDGTTQSVTATVAAIAASTQYKLKIRKSGSSVFFSVDGGTEVQQTSNLPAAATEFGIDLMAANAVAGATHPIKFSRYRCIFGT